MDAEDPSLYEPLTPASADAALAALTPPVHRWFVRRYQTPTPGQRLMWPAIKTGGHLLLSAPTGTGKTLAAFLPIVGRILEQPPGGLTCLYIAPLKALVRDVVISLRTCLKEVRAAEPIQLPRVRVGLRTGDTKGQQRRRLWTEPPPILATTPESLALLLSYPAAADLFSGIRWVVIDEVHALTTGKRGCDLSLSLERVTALAARPPQRIGLSATCTPLDKAAGFLAGAGRRCSIASVGETGGLDLRVEPLPAEGGNFVGRLMDRLEDELQTQRTTLIFANARGLAERLVWALRQRHPEWHEQTAVHHSALAASRRRLVERRLKQGLLRVIVSSTSLELGIDIGTIDNVVVVHPPGAVIRLLQRLGRSGHGPDRTRRGLVLTDSPAELLEATVTAASSRASQWESIQVPDAPLDVLCQQLLGLAASAAWTSDDAFALVRRAYPYRALIRADFDDCIDYLSGRNRAGEPWLPSRLRWETQRFCILDDRAARVLRRNIGTILTEEPCAVRLSSSPPQQGKATPTRVGDVEEAFADRLSPGDRFLLDGRCLELRRMEAGSLLVEEVIGRPAVPRWTSDGWPLSRELARRLFHLRVQAAEALRDGPAALADLLQHEYHLGERATSVLVEHFQIQECVSEIPEGPTLLLEAVDDQFGGAYYLHTPLNRVGNDALGRVLVHRLLHKHGLTAASVVADLGLALFLAAPARLTPERLMTCMEVAHFDHDLARAVADSIALREEFRKNALIALMLLRNPLGPRRRVGGPDWAERRLFDQVRARVPDFVLLRQAERDVRTRLCDAGAARAMLEVLPAPQVRWRWLDRVSPFAEAWTQPLAGPVGMAEAPVQALERLHAALTVENADGLPTR